MSGSAQVILIVLFTAVIGAASLGIARLPRLVVISQHLVATNLTLIGASFLFFAGFVAAEVYSERADARAAMSREVGALRQVARLAETLDMQARTEITSAVRSYADAVRTDEWTALDHGEPAPSADETFQRLSTLTAVHAEEEGAAARFTTAMDTIFKSRYERIDLAGSSVGGVKWLAFGVLAFASMITVATVNSGRRDTQIFSVGLYASVVVTILTVIAVQDRPFSDPLKIEPDIYKTLSNRLAAPLPS